MIAIAEAVLPSYKAKAGFLKISGKAESFRQHVGDAHLHIVGLAAKDDSRVCAKFGNHLAASAAGGTWHIVFRDHSNAPQLQLALGLMYRVEDRRALSADGQPVRGVFDVASGIEMAIVGNDGGPDAKL